MADRCVFPTALLFKAFLNYVAYCKKWKYLCVAVDRKEMVQDVLYL